MIAGRIKWAKCSWLSVKHSLENRPGYLRLHNVLNR